MSEIEDILIKILDYNNINVTCEIRLLDFNMLEDMYVLSFTNDILVMISKPNISIYCNSLGLIVHDEDIVLEKFMKFLFKE